MHSPPVRGRHQVAFNRAEARGCPKSNHFLFSAHIYGTGWNPSPTQGARSARPGLQRTLSLTQAGLVAWTGALINSEPALKSFHAQLRILSSGWQEVIVNVINIADKFSQIQEYYRPRIAGELNDAYLKLVKLKGEFVWHQHENEDELFLVVKGRLLIKLRDRDLWLDEGEFVIIPKGVEHCPVAEEEVQAILLEPKSTLNTGNVLNERTVAAQWI